MRLHCYYCGKPVSTGLPEDTVVRAVLECPECIKAQPGDIDATVCGFNSDYNSFTFKLSERTEYEKLGPDLRIGRRVQLSICVMPDKKTET